MHWTQAQVKPGTPPSYPKNPISWVCGGRRSGKSSRILKEIIRLKTGGKLGKLLVLVPWVEAQTLWQQVLRIQNIPGWVTTPELLARRIITQKNKNLTWVTETPAFHPETSPIDSPLAHLQSLILDGLMSASAAHWALKHDPNAWGLDFNDPNLIWDTLLIEEPEEFQSDSLGWIKNLSREHTLGTTKLLRSNIKSCETIQLHGHWLDKSWYSHRQLKVELCKVPLRSTGEAWSKSTLSKEGWFPNETIICHPTKSNGTNFLTPLEFNTQRKCNTLIPYFNQTFPGVNRAKDQVDLVVAHSKASIARYQMSNPVPWAPPLPKGISSDKSLWLSWPIAPNNRQKLDF
jgi:hypothetical protein